MFSRFTQRLGKPTKRSPLLRRAAIEDKLWVTNRVRILCRNVSFKLGVEHMRNPKKNTVLGVSSTPLPEYHLVTRTGPKFMKWSLAGPSIPRFVNCQPITKQIIMNCSTLFHGGGNSSHKGTTISDVDCKDSGRVQWKAGSTMHQRTPPNRQMSTE